MNEIYKTIPGYENLYQVSNLGNVKSLPNTKRKSEKILTPDKRICNHTNYLRVTLSKDGETTRFLVHRLVAQVFVPNTLNKPIVNHIDNNGENNIWSNLEWVTHSENMLHAQKQGRLFETQSKAGKANSQAHYTKVMSELNNMIGNTYGSLTVLEFNHDAHIKHNKYLVKCECERCNTEIQVPFNKLISDTPTQCKGCNLRDHNDTVTQDSLSRIIGKVIDGWYVTDEHITVRPYTAPDKRKAGRITFVKCICDRCNFNTTSIKLRSLETSAYIPRCTVCDNDHTKFVPVEDIV